MKSSITLLVFLLSALVLGAPVPVNPVLGLGVFDNAVTTTAETYPHGYKAYFRDMLPKMLGKKTSAQTKAEAKLAAERIARKEASEAKLLAERQAKLLAEREAKRIAEEEEYMARVVKIIGEQNKKIEELRLLTTEQRKNLRDTAKINLNKLKNDIDLQRIRNPNARDLRSRNGDNLLKQEEYYTDIRNLNRADNIDDIEFERGYSVWRNYEFIREHK